MTYPVKPKYNPGKTPGADACGFHLFAVLEAEALYDTVEKT